MDPVLKYGKTVSAEERFKMSHIFFYSDLA